MSLNRVRRQMKLTVKEAAEVCGMLEEDVRHVDNGVPTGFRTVRLLSWGLGVEPGDLMLGLRGAEGMTGYRKMGITVSYGAGERVGYA